MGAIAVEKSDVVIVTDDNPRTERPEAIRAEILAAAPGAREIGDRARGDPRRRCHAGRGRRARRRRQGPRNRSDRRRQGAAVFGSRRGPRGIGARLTHDGAAVDVAGFADGFGGGGRRRAGSAITGFSLDTRSLQTGEVFVASAMCAMATISSWTRFARAQLRRSSRRATSALRADGALLSASTTRSKDCARSRALPVLVRKRASSLSPAASARPAPRRRCARACRGSGETHAAEKSFNNHWGVPLTLARMPASRRATACSRSA